MGEHVVHLSGDPGALCQSCPVFVQTLVGLRPQGTLPQFEKKLPSGSDEHPPGGDGEGQWSDPQQHRQRIGGRTVDGEEQQGWDPQRGGKQRRPDWAVHSEGEQRKEPGGGGRNRERAEKQTGDRNAERPTPAPPQRDAGQHSAGNVEDNLHGRQRFDGVPQCRAQEQGSERGGDETPDGIDDPVAPGPRQGRVGPGQVA